MKDHPRYEGFFNEETIEQLYKSAPLHDIGKVGVSDAILFKPARLRPEEFTEMKDHTVIGRDAIFRVEMELGSDIDQSFLFFAREIAYTHQEKWDGSGRPRGLKGEEIPISGRLMAIADVYDALISKRVYKPPFSHTKAVEIVKMGRGKHFDPDMVDAFMEIHEQFRQIALEFADHEEEREALKK